MNPFRRTPDTDLNPELAAGLRRLRAQTPTPAGSLRGRQQLRAAVSASAPLARRRPRARLATLAMAGVAGLGLLAASATTGADPVNLVRDLPGPWSKQPTDGTRVELQGIVVRIDEDRASIAIDTNDRGEVTVDVSDARVTDNRTGETDASSLRPGDRVDISAEDHDAGHLEARDVKVERPTGDGASGGSSGGPASDLATDADTTREPTPSPSPTDSAEEPVSTPMPTPTLHDRPASPVTTRPASNDHPTPMPVLDQPTPATHLAPPPETPSPIVDKPPGDRPPSEQAGGNASSP